MIERMLPGSLPPPAVPTFYFIGVTTGQSSSRRMFPRWMEALGRPDVALQGVDLPIHADPALYRRVVGHIKQQPLAVGGLVTTHKIDLLAATRDLFDELGPYARLTDEVSSMAKDDGASRLKLVGRATDPVAGGRSLTTILGPGYFGRTGGEVLLLGAGGSAVALSMHFIRQAQAGDRPAKITVVNRSAERLERLANMVTPLAGDVTFEFVRNEAADRNDALLAELPPHSVVINATGMGKDTPGSPLTNAARFPVNGVAWELNYRGELDFLRQARAQQAARSLIIADGWEYFVRGWAQCLAYALHVEIDNARFAELAESAMAIR